MAKVQMVQQMKVIDVRNDPVLKAKERLHGEIEHGIELLEDLKHRATWAESQQDWPAAVTFWHQYKNVSTWMRMQVRAASGETEQGGQG